jgi:DNA-3-methyladenine glycosylase II
VGQQVSVAAATSINKKLVTALGGQLTATEVLNASDELLRSAGLSRQKVTYIQSLATAEATGSLVLESLPELTDDDAANVITRIKGFGEWSGSYVSHVFARKTGYLACWRPGRSRGV